MSQENVDLYREWIERVNRQDIPGALRLMDPEIRVQHRLTVTKSEGDFTGVDAATDWLADLGRRFASWRIDCDDIRDLGDRVLALGTLRAVGKGSGVEAEWPYTAVASFRDGLVTDYTDYGDRDKALEAAGLSE